MANFRTTNGSQLWISPVSVTEAEADSMLEFQAISDWVKIGKIEDLGEIGDEATAVTGATIEDGRIQKAKGARDAGTQAVICFHDPLDLGQRALIDAEATKFDYPFKLVTSDAPSAGYSNTIQYYRGLVMGKRMRMGTNDNIMRRTFNIGVNSEVFEDVASTA
jgi:hypothetical protein